MGFAAKASPTTRREHELEISKTIPGLDNLAIIIIITFIITTHNPQYFTATILKWNHLLKPDKYKDVIIDSLKFLVKEKWVEVNVFTLMSNHIHLIWQIQNGYEREAVQRDFLKFVSQTIKRDLQINHPRVLEKFYVGAKDRKYLPIAIGMETQSIKYRLMDKRNVYTKDGIYSL